MNTAPTPTHTLQNYASTIYHSAIRLEDTGHYNGGHVVHIDFLDMRIHHIPRTKGIWTSLFIKPIALQKANGPDGKLADIDIHSMCRVFPSEALRFYALCSRYDFFLYHLIRYIMVFLRKGFPRPLLLNGLREVFKKPEHDCGKYLNSPLNWINDICYYLPPEHRYQPRNTNSNTTRHAHAPTPPTGITRVRMPRLPTHIRTALATRGFKRFLPSTLNNDGNTRRLQRRLNNDTAAGRADAIRRRTAILDEVNPRAQTEPPRSGGTGPAHESARDIAGDGSTLTATAREGTVEYSKKTE